MGVDLQKLRERAQEEEAKALARASAGASFWKPRDGDGNRVRLMPPWTSDPKSPNRDQFYREVYVHFGVGLDEDSARVFSCLAKTPDGPKTACPVCQFVEKLRASGVPSDAELADQMRAKQRFYSNIVDLNDAVYTAQDVAEWKARQDDKSRECPFKVGDTKVQLWSYGPMIWNDLMGIFMDSQVDVSDLDKGHNHKVTKTGKGKQTEYRVSADWQPSPFMMLGKALNEALINLDGIMAFQPEAQMLEALQGIGTVALPAARATGGVAPGLPAAQRPAPQPQQQLPAAQPAPQPQPQVQQPAPQPQPQVQQPAPQPQPQQQQQKSLPQVPPADEAPVCYLDKQTCNPEDAECVGGTKDGDQYDKCPFYGPCHAAKFGTEPDQPQKPKGRRSAAKRQGDAPPAQASSVDDLEAQMRASLRNQ